jgi:RNA polymerase sigma-70 factor (ECF subfamily)
MPSSIEGTGPAIPATTPATFAEAYRDYAARVARWSARLGGSDADVEDVVQEVFLVVSRKWPTLRADGHFTSWLFQVTRKIVANQRRHLRWRRLWSGNQELASVPDHGPDPDAELDRQLTLALFHRAVDRLPEKQRTVFVLFELEGMSTAAIAELTQRNLSTVKVQLARARGRFVTVYRRLLRRECDGQDIELGQLAERVINAGSLSAPRLGKKTS